MTHTVYLGLGANLGERIANLRAGLRSLAPNVKVTAVSPLYETDPVGVTDQPPFLNAVCLTQTRLEPDALLDWLKCLERALGRVAGPRWGPRPLDLDILLYDELVLDSERLQIPHPRLAERAFVLRPLADFSPSPRIPGSRRSVRDLLADLGDNGARRVAAPGWESEAG